MASSLFGLSAVGSAKAAFFERTDGSYTDSLLNIPLDKLLIPCVPHQTITAVLSGGAMVYFYEPNKTILILEVFLGIYGVATARRRKINIGI